MLTVKEVRSLRAQGNYREVINAVHERERSAMSGAIWDQDLFWLEKAWAYYQLGEYDQAEKWGVAVTDFSSIRPVAADTRESARLLLAHCAERRGDLDRAEIILKSLPASAASDNLYVTILIGKSRNNLPVSPATVMGFVLAALMRTPYQITNGHIINNAAWLLYGVRQQEDVKPFLPILSGFIEAAIGIYETTGAAKNHRAAALFRASNIFLDVAGWPKAALLVIDQSIELWEQLVASEGGEQYQKNLKRAQTQHEKVLARLG